jgi:hypothetical protein
MERLLEARYSARSTLLHHHIRDPQVPTAMHMSYAKPM